MAPHAEGRNGAERALRAIVAVARKPFAWLRAFFVRDFAKSTVILLFMRSLEDTLQLRRGRVFGKRVRTTMPIGSRKPTASTSCAMSPIPPAEIARTRVDIS